MQLSIITYEVSEMIMRMASICFSEGMIRDDEWELCQEIVKQFPLAGEKWFRDVLESESET